MTGKEGNYPISLGNNNFNKYQLQVHLHTNHFKLHHKFLSKLCQAIKHYRTYIWDSHRKWQISRRLFLLKLHKRLIFWSKIRLEFLCNSQCQSQTVQAKMKSQSLLIVIVIRKKIARHFQVKKIKRRIEKYGTRNAHFEATWMEWDQSSITAMTQLWFQSQKYLKIKNKVLYLEKIKIFNYFISIGQIN